MRAKVLYHSVQQLQMSRCEKKVKREGLGAESLTQNRCGRLAGGSLYEAADSGDVLAHSRITSGDSWCTDSSFSSLLWSSPKCLNRLCLTVFSSLRSSLLLVHILLPNFFFFHSTLHLKCFDTALLEQPPLSIMTLCDLPSLWRVSMIIWTTIAKSTVFPIIVISKNKRYPEVILYGWSFIETQM